MKTTMPGTSHDFAEFGCIERWRIPVRRMKAAASTAAAARFVIGQGIRSIAGCDTPTAARSLSGVTDSEMSAVNARNAVNPGVVCPWYRSPMRGFTRNSVSATASMSAGFTAARYGEAIASVDSCASVSTTSAAYQPMLSGRRGGIWAWARTPAAMSAAGTYSRNGFAHRDASAAASANVATIITTYATKKIAGRATSGLRERLVEVPEDVVEALQPDRQSHHVRRHAGLLLLLFVELAVRGRRRMDHQRLGVADVGEVAHEGERLDELHAGVEAALDAECEERSRALRQVLLCERVIAALGQAGVVHPRDLRMVAQEFSHPHRVGDMPIHAHRQRLQPLQQQPRVERRDRRAEDAQHLHARLHGEAEVAEGLVELHAVVARGRLGHAGKLAVVPREMAAFHH